MLVMTACGQNTAGCPAAASSRPSFKSSTIEPDERSAAAITFQGKAMPLPTNCEGRPSALSPSGRSWFLTRQANSATWWLIADPSGAVIR